MDFLLEVKNAALHFWFVKVIFGVVGLFWLVVVLQKIFVKHPKQSPSKVVEDSVSSDNLQKVANGQEGEPLIFDEDELV